MEPKSYPAEIIDGLVPLESRAMGCSSEVLAECISRFLYRKKYQLSMENVAHYCRNGSSGSARTDSIYTPRPGKRSHVKTINKDQYWAEMEKHFPFLKEEEKDACK